MAAAPKQLLCTLLAAMILPACASADMPEDSQAASAALAQRGWAALTDWDAMPLFEASTTREFASHQRYDTASFELDPGNEDFNSFLAVWGDRPALLDQEVDGSVAPSATRAEQRRERQVDRGSSGVPWS